MRLLLLVFLAAIVSFQTPTKALACSCMMQESIQEAIDETSVIFTGTVSGVRVANESKTEVLMDVHESWKGLLPEEKEKLTVQTANDSAGCGFGFEEGETYLVYTDRHEPNGKLYVSLCSATKSIEDARVDLDYLSKLPSKTNCSPYMCTDGTQLDRCAEDGSVINYFAEPCLTHGGEMHNAFSDVPADHPHVEAIAYMKGQGFVEGYEDGSFKPDQKINRAEFVKIVIGVVYTGDYHKLCDPHHIYSFSDASQDAWYSGYLCLAVQHDIVGGYPDNTFRPSASVNFAEAAKIIAATDAQSTDGGVANEMPPENLGPWYERYVKYLADFNAIPLSVRTLDEQITRGEMAEIIYRLRLDIDYEDSRTFEQMTGYSYPPLKKYTNEEDGYSLSYPSRWVVKENDTVYKGRELSEGTSFIFPNPTPQDGYGARFHVARTSECPDVSDAHPYTGYPLSFNIHSWNDTQDDMLLDGSTWVHEFGDECLVVTTLIQHNIEGVMDLTQTPAQYDGNAIGSSFRVMFKSLKLQ